MAAVIECVRFRVREGVERGAVAAAAESTANLSARPGFLGRELGVSAEGEWLDLIHWASLEAALAAGAAFVEAPSARPFLELLETGSLELRHYHTLDELETPRDAARSGRG